MSRRAVELTFVTAVLAAEVVGAILLIHASDHEPHKVLAASLAITAGVSFVFAGLIALHLRPENPTGLYLALVGFLWFFGALPEANNNVVYTIGAALANLCFIPFAALMLSFPTGRLDRTGKRIVKATAWFVVLGPPIVFLVSKTPKWGCSGDCPESADRGARLPDARAHRRAHRDSGDGRDHRVARGRAGPALAGGDGAREARPPPRLRGRDGDPRWRSCWGTSSMRSALPSTRSSARSSSRSSCWCRGRSSSGSSGAGSRVAPSPG